LLAKSNVECEVRRHKIEFIEQKPTFDFYFV
jgi:hypothetical protein